MSKPRIIFVFSGKRKSGKDYVTDILKHRLGTDHCAVLRLSGPLKRQYAEEHNLDYNKLLDASDYKEKYRADMIRWGEEKRDQDPGFFCRIIVEGPESEKPIWIISDARRTTDLSWFKDNYAEKVVTVRIQADTSSREQRGWIFTEGIDDAPSECGLDAVDDFDIVITNNGHDDSLERDIQNLEDLVKKYVDEQL